MIQCKRLGYAVMTSSDPEGQVAYYTDVIGLVVSQKSNSRIVLATQQGLEAIVLMKAEQAGLSGIGFEISPALSLEEAKADLARSGIAAEMRDGAVPTAGRVLAFRDPKGTEIELFHGIGFADVVGDGRGVGTLKLGHVAYNVPDAAGVSDFYIAHLGFKKADWMGQRQFFLRCSSDHHTVNFFRGEQQLHHIAFEVKDFSELVRSVDHLVQKGLLLSWGPARHTIGHNCAAYHINHDGIKIELYAEMDQMHDEELGYYDPKPWHEDKPQRPKDWDNIPAPGNKWRDPAFGA
jgi:catechol-2,3-dioxygenase